MENNQSYGRILPSPTCLSLKEEKTVHRSSCPRPHRRCCLDKQEHQSRTVKAQLILALLLRDGLWVYGPSSFANSAKLSRVCRLPTCHPKPSLFWRASICGVCYGVGLARDPRTKFGEAGATHVDPYGKISSVRICWDEGISCNVSLVIISAKLGNCTLPRAVIRKSSVGNSHDTGVHSCVIHVTEIGSRRRCKIFSSGRA